MQYQRKEIPGFSGYYADNQGDIYSCKFRQKYNLSNLKKLKQVKDKDGYLIVCLQNGKAKQCNKGVHRLILETFVGNCPEFMITRHLDGNSSNNKLGNLKWGTRSENEKDKIRHGTIQRGERHGQSKFKEGEVRLVKKLLSNEIPPIFIAKMFKRRVNRICEIRDGKTWKWLDCV